MSLSLLRKVSLVLLLVALALHFLFSLLPTPVFGDDAAHHLFWTEAFAAIRADGTSYPRWLSEGFGGLGTSVFYFYPPLMYFLADLMRLMTGQATGLHLFQLAQLTALIASIMSCFFLLRRYTGDRAISFLGALLYGLAPYRYLDVFTRSALTEHGSFLWLPLIFLACEYSISDDRVEKYKGAVLATISFSGLALTNIPMTALIAVLLPVYIWFRAENRDISRFLPLVGAAALTGLITAFYLLPVVSFREYVQTEKLWDLEITGTRWHHSITEILLPDGRHDSIVTICLFTLVVSLVVVGLMFTLKQRDKLHEAWLVVMAVAVFLQIPFLSDWIWDILPPLHLAQFSWRLDGILTLGIAVVLALWLKRGIKYAPYGFASIALFSCLWYFKFLYVYLTYPAPPDLVGELRRSAPEYVPRFAERDTKTMLQAAAVRLNAPAVTTTSPGLQLTAIQQTPAGISFTTRSTRSESIRIDHFYWPALALHSSDTIITLTHDDTGRITAILPPGERSWELRPIRSSSERTGAMISIIGVAIFAGLCLTGFWVEQKASSKR